MISVEFGVYPLTAILLAALLYGVYRLLIRMRCHPRTGQRFIVASVVASILVSFAQPVRYEARQSIFEKSSSDSLRTESKEPLIVVDGIEMGHLPELQNGRADDDERRLSRLLNINEEDISSVAVLRGSSGTAVYGLKGKNGVIEVSTKKPLLPLNILTQSATSIMCYVYFAGLCAMLIYLLTQIFWLIRIRQRSTHMEMEDRVRVYDTDVSVPFSFGNSIFIPAGMEKGVRDDVFLHESKHLSHHHYSKLCIMQLIQTIGWFNPFVWLFTNEHKLQQEMEVDLDVMDSGRDREQYQMNLLKMCLKNNSWVQIIPAFGGSVIKCRILFMNNWKPSRVATFRVSAAFLVLFLIFGTTAFATFHTKVDKNPFDGCWTCEWIRNSNEKYERVPSLTGNMFYGNDMMMNFTWFSRYNGVNMRFNFSGEPQVWQNGKIYNYKGEVVDITLKDNGNKFQSRWTRTPKMTNLVSGPSITEQFRRVEPDKDVLRIVKALSKAKEDRRMPVSGVWQEEIDSVQYLYNYYVVSGGIYARFTVWIEPGNYWCSAGGWCGDFRYEGEDKVFLSDRTANIEWHDRDSMTLIIPRDSGVLEPHVYHRSKLPDRFLQCLTAAEGFE